MSLICYALPNAEMIKGSLPDNFTYQVKVTIAAVTVLVVLLTMTLVLRIIWKEKSQDLGGNWTHNFHNSSVTALPVELSSPWEQGGGELGICIEVLVLE